MNYTRSHSLTQGHTRAGRIKKAAAALVAVMAAAGAHAQATLYENGDFSGRSFTAQQRVGNLADYGFNDRASSLVINRDRWEICDDAGFNGHCVVLGPGRYDSLRSMGLNDRVSSMRVVTVGARYEREDPRPARSNYRRRGGERLFEANVVSVRAVVGPPERRCWVEREQVAEPSRPNVGGAIAGALIGGILGHQIGGGTGKDLATAGGAVAGAAVGSNINRDDGGYGTRDVQRCTTATRNTGKPDYWDVTYTFRGQEHRMQTTEPPGSTVTVNDRGEPRTS